MGSFLKAVGRVLWRGVRSKAFREVVTTLLLKRLQEDKENRDEVRG